MLLYWILGAVGLICCVIGLAEVICFIEERFMDMGPKKTVVSVIPVQGHMEKAEYILRSAVFELEGIRHHDVCVIVVDKGADEETRQVCSLMSKEFSCISVCDEKQLPGLLQDKILLTSPV